MSLLAPVHIEYQWREGSVPPPEHYELTIEAVTNGGGQIVFVPGYPAERCGHWVETFQVDPLKAEAFEAYLLAANVFDRPWREISQDTVGGSQRGFRLRRGASRVDIPEAGLAESDARAADALESLIRALVPDEVWRALRNRHAAYLASGCP